MLTVLINLCNNFNFLGKFDCKLSVSVTLHFSNCAGKFSHFQVKYVCFFRQLLMLLFYGSHEHNNTLHIGPARGHIVNSMALKNRGIWLKISALAYIL